MGLSMLGGSNTFLPVCPKLTRAIMPMVIRPMPPTEKLCNDKKGDIGKITLNVAEYNLNIANI